MQLNHRRFKRPLGASVVAAWTITAVSLAAAADPVYLDEPRPEPPPKVMGKISVPEKYEDGSTRVEREVLRMSDDTLVNDGKFTEYYRNGQKFAEGAFKEGVHEGKWTFWHPNGQVAKAVTFSAGVPDGEWDVYDDQGNLTAHKAYKKGRRHGKWTIYHDDGATPKIEQNYVENKLQGARTTYYANGKPHQEARFKDGVLDGMVTEWDETGRKVAELTFEDGKQKGKLVTWGPDGAKTEQAPRVGGLDRAKATEPLEKISPQSTQQDQDLRLMDSQ